MFATDSQELVTMVREPDTWPRYKTELEELKTLRGYFPDFTLMYCPRDMNGKADILAKNARQRKLVFFTISTSVPHWFQSTTVFG